MSQAAFTRALSFVLQVEGGYSNNPADKGGETRFGISKRSYPRLDIKNLTVEQAGEIYRRDFWIPSHCESFPEKIAIAHFDAAVNCGPGSAARMLQRSLGVAGDGKIGPATLAALAKADERLVLDRMLWTRLRYYFDISDNPTQLGFLRGWILRVMQLRVYLETGVAP